MEHLFSTTLTIDTKSMAYQVYFDHEKYIFEPEKTEDAIPSFSFKRESDEWHVQDEIGADFQNQAVDALENYLLSQH